MKKHPVKWLLLLFAWGAWAGAKADDVSYIMRVNLVNGTVDEYLVADHPRVDFVKETIYVSSAALSATYATSDVESYTFVDANPSAIEEVQQTQDNLDMSVKFVDGETVEIRGKVAADGIAVFSIDGRRMNAAVTLSDGGVNVSLSGLPTGAYIINIKNGKSVKVLKR